MNPLQKFLNDFNNSFQMQIWGTHFWGCFCKVFYDFNSQSILVSKLLQQLTHLQVYFSWGVMWKAIVPVMKAFIKTGFFKVIGAKINVLRRISLFSVYSSYPCSSIEIIFLYNKKGFVCAIFIFIILSCRPQHIVLQKELSIHQIFHLLNKNINWYNC